MAEASLKLGTDWATKEDSLLGFNDENDNYKPIPFDFSRASIGTRVNRDGLIETVQDNIPRIDFSDGEGSLLLEPQRTNLVADSTDLTNASFWFKYSLGNGVNPVITSNYAISPDGTQNASRVELDAVGTEGSDRSRLYTTISTTSGTDYTFSFYAKSNTGGNQYIRPRAQDVLYSEITITNEWQRFDVSFNAISTGSLQYGFEIRGNFTENSADILIYGVQLEAGSYSTSLIPTSGSAVTRVADSCSKTGASDLIGQTEGTIYVEIGRKITSSIALFECGQGSSQHRFFAYTDASSKLKVLVVNNYAIQVNYTSTVNVESNAKIAIGYANNNYAIYLNGSLLATDTSATVPPMNQIAISSDRGTIVTASNQIKETKLYNTRLSNAELEELTTL